MTDQNLATASPTREEMELTAADFYARIRKPSEEWKTVDDVAAQLAEFEHSVRGKAYTRAYWLIDQEVSDGEVVEAIGDHLVRWGRLGRLVELRKKLVGNLEKDLLEATNLGNLGHARFMQGNMMKLDPDADDGAIESYQKAIEILQQSDEPDAVKNSGYWTGRLGEAHIILKQFDLAIENLSQAKDIAQEVRDTENEAYWISGSAWAYHMKWEAERDNQLLDKILENSNDALRISNVLSDENKGSIGCSLARYYFDVGMGEGEERRLEEARSGQEGVIPFLGKAGNPFYLEFGVGNLGSIYYDLGLIKHDLGLIEKAIVRYQEAQKTAHDIGDARGEGIQFSRLGRVCQDIGDSLRRSPEQLDQILKPYERAVHLQEDARALFVKARDVRRAGAALGRLGNAYYSLGRIKQQARGESDQEAQEAFQKALDAHLRGLAIAGPPIVQQTESLSIESDNTITDISQEIPQLRKLLFSVGWSEEYQADLEDGKLSPAFRDRFEKYGITLSDDLAIETQVADSEWRIKEKKDSLRTFTVDKEDEDQVLRIYLESFDPRGVSYHYLGWGKILLATAKYSEAFHRFSVVLSIQEKLGARAPLENKFLATLGKEIANLHLSYPEHEAAAIDAGIRFAEEDESPCKPVKELRSNQPGQWIRTVRSALDMIGVDDIPPALEPLRNLHDCLKAEEEKFPSEWAGSLILNIEAKITD